MQKSPYQSRIKIFLDGADKASMIEMAKSPLVQGFTTNPTLIKKAGVKDYEAFCREMLGHIGGKPISFEVFADEFGEMKRQAELIRKWEGKGDNVYVKIPIVNSKGQSSIRLIHELSHEGIKLNITAMYTARQVAETASALTGGAPSIVSVFAGRIADTGRDPVPLMSAAAELCEPAGPHCELLWASTREAFNIVQAEMVGCKIITSPLEMIKKVSHFNKSMEDLTLDTVRTFKADAEGAGFRL